MKINLLSKDDVEFSAYEGARYVSVCNLGDHLREKAKQYREGLKDGSISDARGLVVLETLLKEIGELK